MPYSAILNGQPGDEVRASINAQHQELYTKFHDPVTVQDTAELDFLLSGQQISATIKAGSIASSKLDTNLQIAVAAALSALQPAALSTYETTTQLNLRDTNNRARGNHTGTQLASTISDFTAAVQAVPGFGTGEANFLSFVGVGEEISTGKFGAAIIMKRLKAGTGISIATLGDNSLQITNTGSGGGGTSFIFTDDPTGLTPGIVPAPGTPDGRVLTDSGWDALPTPVLYDVFNSTNDGLVPNTSLVTGAATKVLNALGQWIENGSGGGGAVASVNGQTGTVVLNDEHIAVVASGNLTATTVQGALLELQGDIDTINSNSAIVNAVTTAHINGSDYKHPASVITYSNAGMAATHVAGALDELMAEKLNTADVVTAIDNALGSSTWQAGGGGAGIDNVVEDTTPQLGGNLDVNGFDITGLPDLTFTRAATVTAAQGHLIVSSQDVTYNFASAIALGLANLTGTHTFAQAASGFGACYTIADGRTFVNGAGTTHSAVGYYGARFAPTFKATDNRTVTQTTGYMYGTSPTVTANSGSTITVTDLYGYVADVTAGANGTITNHKPFIARNAVESGGGVITSAAGFISNLGSAAANITAFLSGTETIPAGNFNMYQGNTHVNRWNGGQRWKVNELTDADLNLSTLSTANQYHHLHFKGSTNDTVTLPEAVNCIGQEVCITSEKTGGTKVFVATSGSDAIHGLNFSLAPASDGLPAGRTVTLRAVTTGKWARVAGDYDIV